MSFDNKQEFRLVNVAGSSKSPYVRSHKDNLVSWQTWGPEVVELAKKTDRLLFVSIGYSACHWCHVMEKESFMSPDVAAILNTYFIPVKVDREERPDIDDVYMNYVQATTGSGGWPLNVFLTPDLEPLFGGTYWPGPGAGSASRFSAEEIIGFMDILDRVKETWLTQRTRCLQSAKEITRQLKEFAEEGTHSGEKAEGSSEDLELELLEEAYQHFAQRYDAVNGGFSDSPKFPTPNLSFLIRLRSHPQIVTDIVGAKEIEHATEMVIHTLRKIARSGLRDHLGHGFARYSVTADWSLPHFEKMVGENALLLDIYIDAFLATQDRELLGCVYDIVSYLTSEPILSAEGAFCASEDADSLPSRSTSSSSPTREEKREGAFYLFTYKEISSILSNELHTDIFTRHFNIRPSGNVSPQNDPHDEFMTQNVLSVVATPAALAKEFGLPQDEVIRILKSAKEKVAEHRNRERPRPDIDDKIVVAYNGLVIAALARAATALASIGDVVTAKKCQDKAETAAAFIRKEMYDEASGCLWRMYREGRGTTEGFLDDYVYLIRACLELYEATFDDEYIAWAVKLQEYQNKNFIDLKFGPGQPSSGFFTTAAQPSTPKPTTPALLRLKQGTDTALPSPNGIATQNLHRLANLSAKTEYRKLAQETADAFAVEVLQWPFLFVSLLMGVGWEWLGGRTVVFVDGETEKGKEEMIPQLRARLRIPPSPPVTSTVLLSEATGKQGSFLRKENEVLAAVKTGSTQILFCDAGKKVCRSVTADELPALLRHGEDGSPTDDDAAASEKKPASGNPDAAAAPPASTATQKVEDVTTKAVETVRAGIEKLTPGSGEEASAKQN